MRPVFATWSSKIREPRTEVIRTDARWREVWPEVTPSGSPEATPNVNFTREMLLLVARGTQSTGCPSIKVESVAREGNGVVATVAHIDPGSRCGCIAALGHPVDVVAVTRVEGNVRFQFVTRVNECP